MTRIELLDKAAENGTRFKDIDINPTFGAAYFYSVDAENELINFAEVIWDYDIDPILESTSSQSAQHSQALSQQLQSFKSADAPLTDLQKSTAATTTGKLERKNAFLHSR